MTYDITRRELLKTLGMAGIASMLPLHLAFANTPQDHRLLLVIMRGGMDGLGAIAPIGDRSYADMRGAMRLPEDADTLINLDNYFAMHQSLSALGPLFHQKEMLILHATATPYRDRSHFDAQNLLENGSNKAHSLTSGWLNRAVASLQGSPEALAVGPAVPLVLRGQARVTSWAPSLLPDVDDDFLARVMSMYHDDPLLSQALSESKNMQESGDKIGTGRGPRIFVPMMQKAASFLSSDNGPRIASIDIGGWDTHANQGLTKGRLPTALSILADGLVAFRTGMGQQWDKTAVLAVTEFGRTVKGNGSGGTDHGTGSIALLLGGNINGGRVIGDWPGLARLYEDRDLMPANDLRSLLKGTLASHLGIPEQTLASQIFPGSSSIRPLNNLIKTTV